MFSKNDKIKVKENAPLFAGKTGIVLDANKNEAKVKINLDESNEGMKSFVNIFTNEELEIDTMDNILVENIIEEEAIFENDLEDEDDDEEYIENARQYAEKISKMSPQEVKKLYYQEYKFNKKPAQDEAEEIIQKALEAQLKANKMTNEEFECWLADHDASYLTQEITEDFDCPVRGQHGEIIATYNFKTMQLTESLFDVAMPSIEGEHTEEIIPDCKLKQEDFIHDYLYDENIDDLNDVIPSWEFVQIIAAAENVDDETVIQEAIDRGYKMFVIRSYNFERLAIAAKGIEAEDIYEDYADYLQGNPTVTELTRK